MMKKLLLMLLLIFLALTFAQTAPAQVDEDGDGYYTGSGPNADCDDDALDDPALCATCSCGEDECCGCARCIHPGAYDVCGDVFDSNCNPERCACEDD